MEPMVGPLPSSNAVPLASLTSVTVYSPTGRPSITIGVEGFTVSVVAVSVRLTSVPSTFTYRVFSLPWSSVTTRVICT